MTFSRNIFFLIRRPGNTERVVISFSMLMRLHARFRTRREVYVITETHWSIINSKTTDIYLAIYRSIPWHGCTYSKISHSKLWPPEFGAWPAQRACFPFFLYWLALLCLHGFLRGFPDTLAAGGDFGFKVTAFNRAEETKKLSAKLTRGKLASSACFSNRG